MSSNVFRYSKRGIVQKAIRKASTDSVQTEETVPNQWLLKRIVQCPLKFSYFSSRPGLFTRPATVALPIVPSIFGPGTANPTQRVLNSYPTIRYGRNRNDIDVLALSYRCWPNYAGKNSRVGRRRHRRCAPPSSLNRV